MSSLKSRSKVDDSGCWVWEKAKSTRGYPMVWCTDRKKTVQGHRLAWEQVNGPIPKGAVIRHLCHNPACVNPGHLKIGTQYDNAMDDYAAGNRTHAERFDPFGNPLPIGMHYKHGRYFFVHKAKWESLSKTYEAAIVEFKDSSLLDSLR